MMQRKWQKSNGMILKAIFLLILLISFFDFSSANYQSLNNNDFNLNYQPQESNHEQLWNRFEQEQQQPNYNYDNENYYYGDNIRRKPSPNHVQNSIESDYANADYDDGSKTLAAKRAWKFLFNDRSRGWGKREQQQGNWNNLRGLWGKRSSWSRLSGTWG